MQDNERNTQEEQFIVESESIQPSEQAIVEPEKIQPDEQPIRDTQSLINAPEFKSVEQIRHEAFDNADINKPEFKSVEQIRHEAFDNADISVPEFMTMYVKAKDKINAIDYTSTITPTDKTALKEYSDYKDFLDDVRKSLDFVKSSTFISEGKDGNPECRSLLSNKEQYAHLVNTLTNSFDKKFMKEVEKTRTEPLDAGEFTKQEYRSMVQAAPNSPPIREEIERIQRERELNEQEEYRIREIQEAIQETQVEMERNNISITDAAITALTVGLWLERDEQGETNIIAESEKLPNNIKTELPEPRYTVVAIDKETGEENRLETNDWNRVKAFAINQMIEGNMDVTIQDNTTNESVTLDAEKYRENYNAIDKLNGEFPVEPDNLTDVDYENNHKPKPVEIVESNDGYVMASSEITAENEAEFNSRVNKANNEVIHNEAPQETTIDPTAVGGKVKLEVVEDLGSRELSQIENGGGAYGSLADRYENTKYDETPDDPDEEQEEAGFSGFDDIC